MLTGVIVELNNELGEVLDVCDFIIEISFEYYVKVYPVSCNIGSFIIYEFLRSLFFWNNKNQNIHLYQVIKTH